MEDIRGLNGYEMSARGSVSDLRDELSIPRRKHLFSRETSFFFFLSPPLISPTHSRDFLRKSVP